VEKLFKALAILVELSEFEGINLIKQSVNGIKLKQYEFSLLIYFLTLGVGVEVDREQIITDTYMPAEWRGEYRLQERSIDSFLVYLNRKLKRAKFGYLIENFGSPRNPRGFQLTKKNAGLYEEVGEQ